MTTRAAHAETGTTRTLADYRPQHDEGCAARPHYDRWGTIAIEPCTCGLDALIAAVRHEAGADRLHPPKWQAVETAPKDGRMVLVYAEAYNRRIWGRGFYFKGVPGDGEGWIAHTFYTEPKDDMSGVFEPTHWQPLPAPPSDRLHPHEDGADKGVCAPDHPRVICTADQAAPTTETASELGLNVDMLDVDRLRDWARLISDGGHDITNWADSMFVASTLRDIADRLALEVRDVLRLRERIKHD